MQVLALVFAFIVGKQAPPSPPAENPHPPLTAEEKTSVALAEQLVKACLVDNACPVNGTGASELFTTHGALKEMKHMHVVPRSTPRHAAVKSDEPPPADMIPLKDDEYAVHVYARFDKHGGWYDVSIVLSKDNKLRRFLAAPMESHHKLPPGAKC